MGRHEAFGLFSISLLIGAPRMFQCLECLHMKQVNNTELILEKRLHQILAINYYRFSIMVSLNKAIDQNKTKRVNLVLHSFDNSISVLVPIGRFFPPFETLYISDTFLGNFQTLVFKCQSPFKMHTMSGYKLTCVEN